MGAIEQTHIDGFDGCEYIDQLQGHQRFSQQGSITISEEVDRIYQGCTQPAVIHDKAYDRQIKITTLGSTSAVVWNPWITKSQGMSDLGNEDYHGFVCINSNAGDDTVTLQPGDQHILQATIGISE